MAERTRCLHRGDDSIDTSTPKVYQLNGRDVKRLEFRLCLEEGEDAKRITVTRNMPISDGRLRQEARKKAEELLADRSTLAGWTPSSSMAEFIREKIVGEYFLTMDWAENTLKTYKRLMLNVYIPAIGKKRSIRSSCTYTCLEETLQGIANKHYPSAKQTAKVLRAHVLPQLVRHRLIERNELAVSTLKLKQPRREPTSKSTRTTLTLDERRRVIDYLLNVDCHAHAKGRLTDEQATAARTTCIDATLLQACTGLRIGEIRELTPQDVKFALLSEHEKRAVINVRPEISKTQKGRQVPVMDYDVTFRMALRQVNAIEANDTYLFPSGNGTQWDRSNAQKAIRKLYNELADELDIPLLREVSTHVWRATLNTIYAGEGMSDAVRSKFFGHTEDVNARYYMDFEEAKNLAPVFNIHTDIHTSASVQIKRSED